MSLTRRDFLRTGTVATIAPYLAARRQYSQNSRALYMDIKAIAILMIERTKGTGIPEKSDRVDLLFVKHPDHEPPRLVIRGEDGPLELPLEGADLRISAKGVPLKFDPIALHDPGAAITCPKNDEWRKLSSIPDINSVLQKSVKLKPSCLDRNKPALVGGRFMMPGGTLAASSPQNPYDGEQWTFPDGNAKYVRAFTDILNWDIPLTDDELTFQAFPFGSNVARQSITVPVPPDGLLVRLDTPRLKSAEAPLADRIVHFRHYYEYLDYEGGIAPIPVKSQAICPLLTRTFTYEQLFRFKEIRELFDKLEKRRQDDDFNDWQASCDVSVEESAMRRRSADTFCPPLVVFEGS